MGIKQETCESIGELISILFVHHKMLPIVVENKDNILRIIVTACLKFTFSFNVFPTLFFYGLK